jgi:site-specific recombinase XerD
VSNSRRFTLEQTRVSELLEPLETWWDDYARSMRRRNMSARTAHLYRRAYLRFWRWAPTRGIDPDPAAVTTDVVNRWVDMLRDDVSPQTVAIYWRTLRPFFAWCARETDGTNPFDGADVPGEPRNPPDVIDLDDIR